jgi:crotonobetainyl-CoA:carnitine CoA-transferase CaiB-like acyl-CoA transferase
MVIGATGDSIYSRLMHLIGAPHLAGPAYMQNHQRVVHQVEIEATIAAWTRVRSAEEVEARMAEACVPVGRVVSVREIADGEQVRARGALQDVWVPRGGDGAGAEEGWTVKMLGTVPQLEGCDPKPRWAGPDLGAHTDEVLTGDLGLSAEEMDRLREGGVIE